MEVTFKREAVGVDWKQIAEIYRISRFDNGRPLDVLQQCFENSQYVCFAMLGDRLLGTARAISDRTTCSTIFDVCVHPNCRRRGVGTGMMRELLSDMDGQFVVLVASEPEFYQRLGFVPEKGAMIGNVRMAQGKLKVDE